MPQNSYAQGIVVRCFNAITDIAGAPVDPSVLKFTFVPPGGTPTVYTFGGGQIVKDSSGNYHVDIPTAAGPGGRWEYEWYSTGTGASAGPGSFFVVANDPQLPTP